MPKGLANLLTRAEFVDLVRFLSELGKPGPYAIQAGPDHPALAGPEGRRPRTSRESSGPTPASGRRPTRWSPATCRSPRSSRRPRSKVAYHPGRDRRLGRRADRLPASTRAKGLTAWLDDQPLPTGDAPTVEVAEGTHKLTLKVDADGPGRPAGPGRGGQAGGLVRRVLGGRGTLKLRDPTTGLGPDPDERRIDCNDP